MLGLKKKKAREVRWLITFADLITLLFCFFVYLSLFSKPSVSLQTRFRITEQALLVLKEALPASVISGMQSLSGLIFNGEQVFYEGVESWIGKDDSAKFRSQIVLESIADDVVDESGRVAWVEVILSEPVQEDLKVPLFFSGMARRGPDNQELCTDEGLTRADESTQGFDYLLSRESISIESGETTGRIPICIIDDELYEGTESIRVQIGNVRGNVERGTIISKNVLIHDNEPPPRASFNIDRRDIFKGIVSLTVQLDRVSGTTTEIPVSFKGTAYEGVDFRLIDPPVIRIFPYTEKGSIQLEIMQDEVPLYATRTLLVEMNEKVMRNVRSGGVSRQVNSIIGALEMKDCSGIHRFLKENHGEFAAFELNASKSRCILILPSEFLFKSGSADLKPENLRRLKKFLGEIRDRYELEGDAIRVEGHTDDVPLGKRAEYRNNWELSVARATNIGVFMMEKIGYVPELLSISGYADTRPRVSYRDSEGRRKDRKMLREARSANRRVEIIFTRPPQKERTRRFFPDTE